MSGECTSGDSQLAQCERQTLRVHVHEVVTINRILWVSALSLLVEVVVPGHRMEVDVFHDDRLDGQRHAVLCTRAGLAAQVPVVGVGCRLGLVAPSYTLKHRGTTLAGCDVLWVGGQGESLGQGDGLGAIVGLSTFQIVYLSFGYRVVRHVVGQDGVYTGGHEILTTIGGTLLVAHVLQYGVALGFLGGVGLDDDRFAWVSLHTYHGGVVLAVVVSLDVVVLSAYDVCGVRLQAFHVYTASGTLSG